MITIIYNFALVYNIETIHIIKWLRWRFWQYFEASMTVPLYKNSSFWDSFTILNKVTTAAMGMSDLFLNKLTTIFKRYCQKWDLNPHPHLRTRTLIYSLYLRARSNLEYGTLDQSAILIVIKHVHIDNQTLNPELLGLRLIDSVGSTHSFDPCFFWHVERI